VIIIGAEVIKVKKKIIAIMIVGWLLTAIPTITGLEETVNEEREGALNELTLDDEDIQTEINSPYNEELMIDKDFSELQNNPNPIGSQSTRKEFGCSVSISGDYVIVGARCNNDNGDDSGSAHIFKRDDATRWTPQAKLLPSDGEAGDLFGCSVSISGDYAIIGAYCDDDNGVNSGSAYVFKRDGTVWAQQAKLLASCKGGYEFFGFSVSISGDNAIIGAWGNCDNGVAAGSAYVFKRNGTTWTQQAKLLASDGAANDYFGWSVSISGDSAIIGARGDDDNGGDSGSAYIFKRDGTAWTEQDKLLASDGAEDDHFGGSVSIDDNYAIIGAHLDDDNGDDSGSAYVFKCDGATWTQQAKLLASDGKTGDLFGYSVSISGGYAIVGAYCDNYFGFNSGSAYIFKRDDVVWTQEDQLAGPYGSWWGDWLGYSVSIDGNRVIIGAPNDEVFGDYPGSAYVFKRDGTIWTEEDKLFLNRGPSFPQIDGEVNLEVGIEYEYTFKTTDPNGDNIYYSVKWGDGEHSGWVGPYYSDEEITLSHTWSARGIYFIKAKAKDVYGAESGWVTLPVSIPVNQPSSQQSQPFQKVLQQLPNEFPIIQQLLGL